MRALLLSVVLGLVAIPLAQAGDDAVAGNWKVTIIQNASQSEWMQMTPWLLHLESKGGKLEGSAESVPGIPSTTVENLSFSGDVMSFSLKLKNGRTFHFDWKLPRAGAKKIQGTFSTGGGPSLALMEATTAKTLYDADREFLARSPNDPRVFSTALDLIAQAKEKKTPVKDVQEWADVAMRAAENYGPKWQLDFAPKLVDRLHSQEGYAGVAVETMRKLEKSLDVKTPAETQLRVLTALAGALEAVAGKNGKPSDEAKQLVARIDKLENQGYAEYQAKALDFKIEKFKGRKGKSDRAVLVELFTGGQCPPCVAADLGFDALKKAYPPTEVVLLQYHLHIPGPDALTNDDAEARQNYYGKAIRGTPTIFFNGVPDAPGGGGREDGAERFKEYTDVINPLLEKPAPAQIKLSAERKGETIQIKAAVQNLEKTGERVRLRLVLVEDWVRYKARNGTSYHHRVVRDFPGGVKGFALTKKDAEHTAVVDLKELRAKLATYLDTFAKTSEEDFPDPQRPMRFRNLSIVAFIQNDDTREVLQAANAGINGE
ncbi:MAG: DUF1223 domain-containing protein [Planctomycetes bacterium]|nr:DUF1223 domain-containing protein [Planctomycetota bacterium]